MDLFSAFVARWIGLVLAGGLAGFVVGVVAFVLARRQGWLVRPARIWQALTWLWLPWLALSSAGAGAGFAGLAAARGEARHQLEDVLVPLARSHLADVRNYVGATIVPFAREAGTTFESLRARSMEALADSLKGTPVAGLVSDAAAGWVVDQAFALVAVGAGAAGALGATDTARVLEAVRTFDVTFIDELVLRKLSDVALAQVTHQVVVGALLLFLVWLFFVGVAASEIAIAWAWRTRAARAVATPSPEAT